MGIAFGLNDVDVSNRTTKEKVINTVDDVWWITSVYFGSYSGELAGPALMAKSPNVTVSGQIMRMLKEMPKNFVAHH